MTTHAGLEELLTQLGDEDIQVRERAQSALVSIGNALGEIPFIGVAILSWYIDYLDHATRGHPDAEISSRGEEIVDNPSGKKAIRDEISQVESQLWKLGNPPLLPRGFPLLGPGLPWWSRYWLLETRLRELQKRLETLERRH